MKKQKKLPYGLKLTIAMSIYAVVFVCVAYFGFTWFWDYIDAYEKSRPLTTMEGYMAQLDAWDVVDGSQDLIDTIDHNIQSEDACREAIANALSGGFSYARKLNECNDATTVYMLMSGGKTVGKVTLSAQAADKFGFTPWVVTSQSFDMSFLIGEGTSVTVPSDFPVYVNGTMLTEEYRTETGIHYPLLEEFYEEFDLPYMVSYQVDAILGDLEVTVTDAQGNPVTPELWADEEAFLSSCTQEQLQQVTRFSEDFLLAYVNYTTNTGGTRFENYDKVTPYLLEGSVLQERVKKALDGLMWVTSRNAEILSINLDRCIPTLDGHMICDLTYEVNSMTIGGVRVDETFRVQIILTQTENGYKAAAMTGQ